MPDQNYNTGNGLTRVTDDEEYTLEEQLLFARQYIKILKTELERLRDAYRQKSDWLCDEEAETKRLRAALEKITDPDMPAVFVAEQALKGK